MVRKNVTLWNESRRTLDRKTSIPYLPHTSLLSKGLGGMYGTFSPRPGWLWPKCKKMEMWRLQQLITTVQLLWSVLLFTGVKEVYAHFLAVGETFKVNLSYMHSALLYIHTLSIYHKKTHSLHSTCTTPSNITAKCNMSLVVATIKCAA